MEALSVSIRPSEDGEAGCRRYTSDLHVACGCVPAVVVPGSAVEHAFGLSRGLSARMPGTPLNVAGVSGPRAVGGATVLV